MRNFLVYALLLTVLVSCENLESEDVNTIAAASAELQGTWELQSANCFCLFADDYDYAANKVTFNETVDEISIETSENSFLITKVGTYPISVENDLITIEDIKEYTFKIQGSALSLTFVDDPDMSDDEITLNYIKQ